VVVGGSYELYTEKRWPPEVRSLAISWCRDSIAPAHLCVESMDVALAADTSATSSFQELNWQRRSREQNVAELQISVKAKSEEVDKLRHHVDLRFISVAKIDGSVIQCDISEDSTVQDLLDVAMAGDKHSSENVHQAHAALLGFDLFTNNGDAMEKDKRLSDYNLGSNSVVMMVKKRFINGIYTCWVQIDHSTPAVPRSEKFTLHIRDDQVSINSVEGIVDGNNASGDQVSVRFKTPILLTSSVPQSRATFHVTGCQFDYRIGDYSSPHWFPVEGRLLGTSSSDGERAPSFKGRLLEHHCA